MTSKLWCPACTQWTALTDHRTCSWCGGPLQQRRGGWQRPDLTAKLTDDQLRVLHRVYEQDGVTMRALAEQVYERVGYASAASAAKAIGAGWTRLRLPARDRVQAARMAWAPKKTTPPALRPPCAGTKTQPPQVGEPCQRPAAHGSAYCRAHDPQGALARQAALRRMRRRPDMLPIEPFTAWLRALAAEHGSLARAIRAYGLPVSAAHRYAKAQTTAGQPKDLIAAATVERWARAAGTTVAEIYGEELAEVA